MNLIVANRDEQKTRLGSIMDAFHEVSTKEKKAKLTFEQHLNRVLDSILDTKKFLQENADSISAFLPKIEEVTWFENVDSESLAEIQKLIANLDDLNKVMIKNYISCSRFFSIHHVGKNELSNYKSTADDVKGLASDLSAVFFSLPFDQDFQALNQELSDL